MSTSSSCPSEDDFSFELSPEVKKELYGECVDGCDCFDGRKQNDLIYGDNLSGNIRLIGIVGGDWDDCVPPEEKRRINEEDMSDSSREFCPYLKWLGNYFCFCERLSQQATSDFPFLKFTVSPRLRSAQVQGRIKPGKLRHVCSRQGVFDYCKWHTRAIR